MSIVSFIEYYMWLFWASSFDASQSFENSWVFFGVCLNNGSYLEQWFRTIQIPVTGFFLKLQKMLSFCDFQDRGCYSYHCYCLFGFEVEVFWGGIELVMLAWTRLVFTWCPPDGHTHWVRSTFVVKYFHLHLWPYTALSILAR